MGTNRFTLKSWTREKPEIAQLAPHEQIEVIPGDVLGFQVLNPGGFEDDDDQSYWYEEESDDEKTSSGRSSGTSSLGIVILNNVNETKNNEEVWYARVNKRVVRRNSIEIGSNGTLNTYTDAAPVISASLLRINTYTSTPNYGTQNAPTLEGSKMRMIVIVANTAVAVLLTVVITIIAVLGICFVIRRRIKTHTLTRASWDEAQGERNTSFYSEDVVKSIRDRNTTRIQHAQVVVQLNQEIQHNDAQAMAMQLNPGPSDFGSSEIELPNSNVDSIIIQKNEAYGKVTFTDSGDYENEYYHEYDYI